ncbi:IS21-like element helper ATPase IstB [Flexithrix dorotheae]|uniref:IS21-like element helper ATPase IstB n=2 Tax=Flexithrix dorotheae TaxID=70993 RepID=UPI001FE21881|nr:IS21-like element helper ATPase IstB [Flexithrix dorotheae]
MSQLKFYGMLQSYQTLLETNQHHSLNNDEIVSMLIQAEWEDRQNRKINRYIKTAQFRYKANIEDIDFTANRALDKTQLLRLADGSFIQKKENLLITGPTGAGKSYIASALGYQACLMGYKTLYFNAQKLFPQLNMSKADGTYLKQIAKIERHDLLIIDDFGLQPLDAKNRMMLLEIIEDRHGRRSTIISSQLPVANWYDIIGDSTVADALLDRMIHTAHRIELKGESLRKRKMK